MRLADFIRHAMHGDCILITYHVSGDRFEEHRSYARVSEKEAYGMGYIRGYKMTDSLLESFMRCYVRFSPDIKPGYPRSIDPQTGDEVVNRETSSTLYDRWKSDSIEKFIKGTTTKTLLPGADLKQLAVIAIIAAAAIAGVIVFTGVI